jgi:hypothetical protein
MRQMMFFLREAASRICGFVRTTNGTNGRLARLSHVACRRNGKSDDIFVIHMNFHSLPRHQARESATLQLQRLLRVFWVRLTPRVVGEASNSTWRTRRSRYSGIGRKRESFELFGSIKLMGCHRHCGSRPIIEDRGLSSATHEKQRKATDNRCLGMHY